MDDAWSASTASSAASSRSTRSCPPPSLPLCPEGPPLAHARVVRRARGLEKSCRELSGGLDHDETCAEYGAQRARQQRGPHHAPRQRRPSPKQNRRHMSSMPPTASRRTKSPAPGTPRKARADQAGRRPPSPSPLANPLPPGRRQLLAARQCTSRWSASSASAAQTSRSCTLPSPGRR